MQCKKCGLEFSDSLDTCPYCGYENIIDSGRDLVNEKQIKDEYLVSPLRMVISFLLHTLLLNILCGVLSLIINVWKNKHIRKYGINNLTEDARLDYIKLSLLRVFYYTAFGTSLIINVFILITKGVISLLYTIFPFLG